MAKKASDVLKNIGQGIYNFLADIGYINRPIGIVGRNYEYIYRTLSRNIGNGRHEYDGYGTPIGSLADIDFNSRTIPWFLSDTNKNMYSNYFNYIRGIYNESSNLSPIDNFGNKVFKLSDNTVGVVRGFEVIKALNGLSVTNTINNKDTDTEIGMSNGFFLSSTLDNASNINTIRLNEKLSKHGGYITSNLNEYLGLNDNNLSTILSKDNFDGLDLESPLDQNNFGNYGTIGVYDDFYNNSSELTKDFIEKSWTGTDLKTDYGYRGGKQKYFPNIFFPYSNYISQMTLVGFDVNISGEKIRYNNKLFDINRTVYTAKNLLEYAEQGNGETSADASTIYNSNIHSKTFNSGINYGTYTSMETTDTNTLIGKTNLNFKHGKYRTLISRFHTDNDEDRVLGNEIQSAISQEYGMSMGRNLLRKDHKSTHKDEQYNGYSNPYCRVWTYHHQYHTIADMIRPLSQGDDKGVTVVKQSELDEAFHWKRFRSTSKVLNTETGQYTDEFSSGGARLGAMGTKNEINGFVNITPIGSRSSNGKTQFVTNTKDCMFSIENLAWKGTRGETFEDGLSDEQKGPFGGRIMWFPPYDISFNENVSVNWSPTSFIGRGENIYTYVNTERSGTLHFKLLIDHPAILDYWKGKGQHTSGSGSLPDGVDDVDSDEQTLLRFFAGCEILAPMATKALKPKPIAPKPKPKPNPVVAEKRSIDKSFTFFVFYPNNYSGIDDKPTSQVSAMEYLINGVGTQVMKSKSGNFEDLSTTNAELFLDTTRVGGYEMRPNKGVSTVTTESAVNRIISTVNYLNNGSKINIELATILNNKTRKEWYYRVDKRVNHEILRKGNYVDTDSFGLNSENGYKELLPFYSGKVKEDELYSFGSVFISLSDEYKDSLSGGLYNDDKVKELQYILNTYKIKEVNAMGIASSHGYVKSNNILNKNRAQSVINWLKSKEIFKKQSEIEYKVKVTEIGNVGAAKSVSDKVPKVYRAAQIEVVYQVDEVSNIQDTTKETFAASSGTTTRADIPLYTQQNYLTGKDNSLFPKVENNIWNLPTVKPMPNDLVQNGNILNLYKQKDTPSENINTEVVIEDDSDNQVNYRYDNEAEFFKLLETKDPFLHNKLVDKIKYFDPAFHSITPEGFNSRLTFLHQCTRQGSTVGSSSVDKASRNANNLAFGRPPICVLRIGDFYYTKIIIDSMSINYDPLVWDLNTEGIGVQPMIADIDISFKFIGGSDLAGPIARLQNAVSFNYYGNTGVYDNRSEMVEYDESGDKIIKFKGYK